MSTNFIPNLGGISKFFPGGAAINAGLHGVQSIAESVLGTPSASLHSQPQSTVYPQQTQQAPAPSAPSAGPSPGYGGGGGGAAPSGPSLADAQAQVANQLAIYGHNYDLQNQDLNTQFGQAQTQHDTQANQLNQYYTQQQGNLDQGKQQADQSLQNLLAGRGISDSTWGQGQQNQANQAYQQQVSALHQDQLGKLNQLDSALSDAKNQLNLQRQNIDISQFQSLDQLQSYLSQFDAANAALNQQHDSIKNAILGSQAAIQKVNTSDAYNSANATQGMLDQINKMIAAGTSKQQIRGYIQQGANKDQIQQLLDYYQNVSGNQPAPATPGLPAA